jgi:ComF family protein
MLSKFGVAEAAKALADLFFPRTCPFCGNVDDFPADAPVCRSCLMDLREVRQPFCQTCGTPVQAFSEEGPVFCGRCLAEPPAFNRARFAVYYEGRLSDALKSFKYYNGLYLGPTLGNILIAAFRRHFGQEAYDLIVPMPLHQRRLIERGFNQSVELASGLASAAGIPPDRRTFRKRKDTPHQVGLSKAERVRNLKGSFEVLRPERFRGRRILLVDDVYTTGSTIAEASKTLAKSKPERLDVLVLALRVPFDRALGDIGGRRVPESEAITK